MDQAKSSMEAFLATKRGYLKEVLRRELTYNPCYFEERYAAQCQNRMDFKDVMDEGAEVPLGGLRRPNTQNCENLMNNAESCRDFWTEVVEMNVREGKEFKFTGQQLKSRIPGYDEREIIYQQAGKNMYTKLYDLPPKSKKFDKFVKDFNASYKA